MPSPSSHDPERAPGRQPVSLPFAVVDDLFHRLSLVYGHLFLGRFSGIDLGAVKEEWRHQLAGITGQELDYAMSNLPSAPPESAIAFRKLAKSMPDDRRLAQYVLPPPSKPREVPREVRPVVAALLAPKPEDAEPAHIVMAREFIARWSAPDARPTQTNQEWLLHWRKVVERWDRAQAEAKQREEAARAATTAATTAQPPENQ